MGRTVIKHRFTQLIRRLRYTLPQTEIVNFSKLQIVQACLPLVENIGKVVRVERQILVRVFNELGIVQDSPVGFLFKI